MKRCLIIIDFQNDFVDGTLGFVSAKSLDSLIVNRIKDARGNNESVIFTQDTHDKDYLNSYEGNKLPVEHCIKGTTGHEIYGNVKNEILSTDKIFYKNTFPSLELANYLKEQNFDEIEVCGLVSNICVLSNVVMARSALPNAVITVDYNLTKSFDNDMNDKCFDILKGLLIEVRNND
ncbi:MAG: cysteine hydrolase family protein [bacterium]